MRVTLTFDNGPDVEGTPMVLSALAERGIPAVFFVVGQKADAHPELLAAASSAGHLIGNHTWSHSRPLGAAIEPGFAGAEIGRTQRAIGPYAEDPPLFRPVGAAPGAVIDDRLLDDEALNVLEAGGYTMALWNVVPHDWERPDDWSDGVLEQCKRLEHAVVVLHDGYPAGMGLLPDLLDALVSEGADFRTDFPRSCTPIVAGVAGSAVGPLVTPRAASR
ncbi:polysaccharide deacetylase family protein [Glaciibacter flavus]|uniref:Polysaccharide deacetylase family protein n=1 Tax=Orlajensenia flava TaxID=2565934 RepID=A0A4S4FRP0_9MICO|nr:polysaccharide deacetylase family protein [Glaciibacter flavus]THG32542.1 polysaccharide deacetylase family protein [Glaciibacter flavus]